MTSRKLARKAAYVAAAAAFAGALVAQPASAAQVTAKYRTVEVAVDNSPGNGAAGWVWVWAGAGDGTIRGTIEYQFSDGYVHSLSTGVGYSKSQSTSSKIKGFRACRTIRVEGYEIDSCGSWNYFW
ncbi:hypothetical protein GCM10009530_02800 [Microbispora corallina]|uniref:Uncharacterized protein n=1 Tax=Microbispora corallina TaxID=83302 RepID=A0ABQ4FRQ8_9ACTN|nr:hypothetical protein [Microbispora corallina]GIH37493.1 hypothetical protein Mco01_04930 [Microbispora corallina]